MTQGCAHRRAIAVSRFASGVGTCLSRSCRTDRVAGIVPIHQLPDGSIRRFQRRGEASSNGSCVAGNPSHRRRGRISMQRELGRLIHRRATLSLCVLHSGWAYILRNPITPANGRLSAGCRRSALAIRIVNAHIRGSGAGKRGRNRYRTLSSVEECMRRRARHAPTLRCRWERSWHESPSLTDGAVDVC